MALNHLEDYLVGQIEGYWHRDEIKIGSEKKNKIRRNNHREWKESKRINAIAKLECIVIGEEICGRLARVGLGSLARPASVGLHTWTHPLRNLSNSCWTLPIPLLLLTCSNCSKCYHYRLSWAFSTKQKPTSNSHQKNYLNIIQFLN